MTTYNLAPASGVGLTTALRNLPTKTYNISMFTTPAEAIKLLNVTDPEVIVIVDNIATELLVDNAPVRVRVLVKEIENAFPREDQNRWRGFSAL